jgi:hypothetical protein
MVPIAVFCRLILSTKNLQLLLDKFLEPEKAVRRVTQASPWNGSSMGIAGLLVLKAYLPTRRRHGARFQAQL